MNVVETISAYKLHTQAQQDVKDGEYGSATRKLQAAATRLLNMGETELAEIMHNQAQALDQGTEPEANVTKKLRYETRKLTQKLG